jgi:hypothetical protein
MSYIGQQLPADTFSGFVTDAFTGDGSATTFTLSKAPFSEDTLIVVINNVIQRPTTNFTVSGTTLTIVGTAVASGDVIYAIHTSGAVPSTLASKVDVNGLSDGVVLDADADTTISADTDDQIDVKIGGTDALRVTGTALTGNALATIGAAGTASTVAGIPFYRDANDSIYTHDVSSTQSTAEANTAFGVGALDAITTGDANTSIGNGTLTGNTSGSNNIAIGKAAINAADTESHNLAIGLNALSGSIAGGEYNLAVGNYAGDAITTSDHNCLMGYQAGGSITLANSDGSSVNGSNACFGNYAGSSITSGYQNTCIGMQAGAGEGDGIGTDPTNGTRNILIGPFANTSGSADVSHAIAIGYAISTGSNNFVFGKASNVVLNDFDTDANWSRSSDVRKKRNINSQGLGLDFINDLRTVNFQWKPSNEFPKEWDDYSEENNMNLDVVMHGFIAQEVKEALDKHAKDQDKNFSGWTVGKDGMQNTSREMFVIPLIKAVQELSAQVEELKAKLEDK